jgi:hypothetical protein
MVLWLLAEHDSPSLIMGLAPFLEVLFISALA